MHRVTIKDIAELAGVSYASVSRAINGTGKISEEKRRRILKICEQEGYRVNVLARNLSRQKTNIIGVVIPSVANPFYSDIILHVGLHARELGYHVMLCNSLYDDRTEEEMIRFLTDQQVDGIVLASAQHYSIGIAKMYQKSVPIVLLGGAYPEEDLHDANLVALDNRAGGRIAAEYLLQLGHKKIVYAGHRPKSMTHRLRLAGFQDILSAQGITPTILENSDNHSSIDNGVLIGRKLFAQHSDCTAIFAATDSLALGIMRAADEAGRQIPHDVSLLGFDNIVYGTLPKIDLTTIDQRKEHMATAAVDMLRELMENDAENAYIHKMIRPELLVRKTCRTLDPAQKE